ncbi:hypothetical protein [Treponema sp.]|uniref:hypothetical protein n=1 Tax=Treponema sp. TaxID=166 RepID=UPI00298D847E|nr:hypothetical protein [Treponema sp.]MCR5613247.1 hypothetical protein [Treponema sp.]
MKKLTKKFNSSKAIALLTGAALILSASLFLSCSSKNKTDSSTADGTQKEERPQWQPSAEKICVVFGYGYNSEEFVKTEIERLEKNFGLSDGTENSGLIIPYVFPDDLKVGNTGRISRLITLLEEVKVAGIITIGAPEYTSNTLATLRENSGDNPFPIYTLFPQDEILAIEATSDFVLDRAVEHSENIEEVKQETEQTKVEGIEDIIDNAIDYMLLFNMPLRSNAELQIHVGNIVGSRYSLKRYVDPETGLSSINHFIIEEKK